MNDSSNQPAGDAREWLSALMDGQAQARDAESACSRWRSDDTARECWHTYHLIGDALRSDELVSAPERDTVFLKSLRERLAVEPVPLVVSPRRERSRLLAPVAAAAGVAAVAGVLVVMRMSAVDGAVLADKGPPDVVLANGQLMRDAQLDRYLAAHRKVANGAAVQVPGATVVRSVDTVVLDSK
ncbi:MAG: sigma-E factor negative regulatory protein [Burkholderiales bacterium]|nr:sigma-E factor negative regulatory protein [Burkholderiales bacterium]